MIAYALLTSRRHDVIDMNKGTIERHETSNQLVLDSLLVLGEELLTNSGRTVESHVSAGFPKSSGIILALPGEHLILLAPGYVRRDTAETLIHCGIAQLDTDSPVTASIRIPMLADFARHDGIWDMRFEGGGWIHADFYRHNLLRAADEWGIPREDSVEATYIQIRSRLARERLEVPFIGKDLRAATAVAMVAILALILAVLFANALYLMTGTPPVGDEPWMGVRKQGAAWGRGGQVASALQRFVPPVLYAGAILGPIVLLGLAVIVGWWFLKNPWVTTLAVLCLVGSMLVLESSVGSYRQLLANVNRT